MVVAEVGGNHGGDFELARKYVKVVARTGADAVKFQMISADKFVVADAPAVPPVKMTQREWFKSLEFTPEQWTQLADDARKNGIMFFASVFDTDSADLLDKLSPGFKIASGDFTNLPLIRHVVKKRKPIFISTGGTKLEEIDRVVNEVPKKSLALMHCISSYPSTESEAHLLTIPFLKERYGVTVGYSDHTMGILASIAAASLGARVIEKHFILDRRQKIGDSILSAEPQEMKDLVGYVGRVEKMLKLRKGPIEAEKKFIPSLRRSLAAATDMKRGTVVTAGKLIPLRPARGISPLEIDEIVGMKARRDIKKGEIIKKSDLS